MVQERFPVLVCNLFIFRIGGVYYYWYSGIILLYLPEQVVEGAALPVLLPVELRITDDAQQLCLVFFKQLTGLVIAGGKQYLWPSAHLHHLLMFVEALAHIEARLFQYYAVEETQIYCCHPYGAFY